MANSEMPAWLKGLPLAPEYRPTETEFADPIAFISRIEREAATFGICKVIPPLPKPSKKFVLANLNRCLSKSPELGPSAAATGRGDAAVFTTRHQELGSPRNRLSVHKQVWQSGEVYTLEQFEVKSKAFAKTQLAGFKEVSPLLVESLFWKAAADKPIYVEYANDVPGSGFGVPEEPFRCYSHRRRRNRGFNKEVVQEPKRPCPKAAGESSERDNTGTGSAGWKLSNSPWNLQVIARSPGSLTRFMPDEVPGVTSPMVYIGMLFSWFAWHVEDHELHSLNFLHMGAPKTWYAVPGEYAATVEEIVRSQGYGGNVDRMAMLGEKTTLLSPEILVASGVPCCRLVQNPGEFVVTFPRAYHVGFSHGFNCGEAANFATPQWLKVAKEAAVRRAAMNYLPMLSHQQLLYMLTMSFISRVPRELLSDVRSSRLRDRKKEEREILVKRAFLDDMLNENNLVCVLLGKESTSGAVLWEPEFLPPPCVGPQSNCSFLSLEAHEPTVEDDHKREMNPCQLKGKDSVDGKSGDCFVENVFDVVASVSTVPSHCESSMETHKNACHVSCMSSQVKSVDSIDVDEDDLPFGLNIDSGSLACVACGILGYPFMAILQPSEKALKELFPVNCEESHDKLTNSQCLNQNPLLPGTLKKFNSGLKECGITSKEQQNPHLSSNSSFEQGSYGQSDTRDPSSHCAKVPDVIHEQASTTNSSHQTGPDNPSTVSSLSNNSVNGTEHGHPMSVADHPDDELDPQNEDSLCGSSNNTKFYHSNALHSCNVMKESGRDALMKTKAIDENVLCSTGFSHRKSLNETDRPCGVPMGKCHSDFLDWNTSNGFQRPRIFCMQHALEIEELLRCKGGARVLIICHSDYLKIKALAISIAEEIDFQFDCKDVPLENASQSDLNLINISIDDEDHDEDGNDWTAKLGLNLKYCAKIRKQSSVNQEKLVLSLGGIFSDPVSVISNLRWLSRKSRTPYKVTGAIQSKSYVSAKNDTNKSLIVKSNVNLPKEIQVYHSRKSKPSRMGAKHLGRPRKATYKEESSYGGTAMADKDDDKTGYDQNHRWSKKVGDVDTDNLLTVPVLVAEYPPMRQDNFAMQRICTSHELVDFAKSSELPVPVNSTVGSCARQPEMHLNELKSTIPICDPKSECCLPYFNVPLVECSALRQRIAEEFSSGCKFGSSETSELQAVVTQEGECATIHRVERVMDETNSEQELNDSVKPVCVPTIRTAKNNEDMQETLMVPLPNSGDNLGTCSLSENQLIIPVSSRDNSEFLLEISASEKSELGNTVGESLRSESHPRANNASMQGHLDERKFTVENLVVNNCEAQQPLTDEAIMDSEVGDSLRSECQFVTLNPVMDDSVNSLGPDTMLVDESSIVPDAIENSKEASGTVDIYYSNGVERTKEKPARVILIPYVRRRNKRTREAEEEKKSDSDNCCNSFIRSPCEGLRPRNGQMIVASSDVSIVEKKVMAKAKKRRENSDLQRGKERFKESFKCDVEGCDMNFGTRGELSLHKRNRCTHEGCGKRFSSHKYAMRHQCVHNDERPLKCPWKGCNMSFKWAWARTEHVRVHTGERPYKCKVSGCGQTFRFVSDFSRHRRKTGHSVNPTSR